MTLQDFVVTPLYLLLIYFLAYIIRDKVTDKNTRRYFIPALTVKIIGAISVGLIYQFYYDGGDTFNYFRDSGFIWEAFKDSPVKAFHLIFSDGSYQTETIRYASHMYFYRDSPSYFVVRVIGAFDLITFHTYSATALLFACASFSGLWAMYTSLYKLYPRLNLEFAVAIFFVPSVFFWGSGILKDTLTLGAVCWATYALIEIIFKRRRVLLNLFILLLFFYVLYNIKIYILLCFLPAAILWIFFHWRKKIFSTVLRVMLTPLMIGLAILLAYFALVQVGEDNRRYSLETLSETAEITANYLYYVSEKQGGSGYTLGDFDYSPSGMIRKIPLAINVSLFRPYLWEVKNPVMLLSAIESLGFLFFTFYVLFKSRLLSKIKGSDPIVIFCFIFSIAFAFAVGFSTYNFGSLVRYKIPLIPFYLIGLFILNYYSKSPRKVS